MTEADTQEGRTRRLHQAKKPPKKLTDAETQEGRTRRLQCAAPKKFEEGRTSVSGHGSMRSQVV